MSADMHIHVLEGVTEEDLAKFQSNVLGSKYFNMTKKFNYDDFTKLYEKFSETPNIHVGEVSWLKAALFDNPEDFVPDPIGAIHDVIGEELPVVDDAMITKITDALKLPNQTGYSLSSAVDILAFLDKHKGKKVFTISW